MKNADDIKAFCGNVKRLRAENGLSKKDMAKIMGTGVDSLNKLEAGHMPVRLGVEAIFNLAAYFHIPADSLFFSGARWPRDL